jgi:branched-chain amino acid transport system permease protein
MTDTDHTTGTRDDAPKAATDATETGMETRLGLFIKTHQTGLAVVLVLALLGLPFVFTPPVLFNLTLMFIFGILAFSAIVPIGYAGQLILSQGAFFGIGAYTFVNATTRGVPGSLSVLLAVLVTAGVAYTLGRPAMKTGGIYLGILTLAFNEMFIIALNLFSSVTGGSKGVSSPALLPESVGVVPNRVLQYYLVLFVFVGTVLLFRRVLESETGWAFLSVKEDPVVAESLGIDARNYRLRAFTMAGVACGLGGALYAPVTGYITPSAFSLERTIDIILTGVAGGLTTVLGSVFGPVIVVLLPELLRFVQDIRLILYGALLILLLIYLPEGIGGWVKRKL